MDQALYPLIRPHYRELQGYVSAGMEAGKDEALIYMNANENPYELPGLEGFNRYPEPQPPALRQAYADAYGVQPQQLLMTRGADEAIVLLSQVFCEPGQDANLICPPTFGMYGVNSRSMPVELLEVPLLRDQNGFALDIDGILDTVRNKPVKLVFLCSPNNPTGNSFPREQLISICEQTLGQAVIVVDETYIEFARQASLSDKLSELANLVILRTLSKSYSMAGMRMGSLLCGDTDFIELLCTKCMDAYPLPRASITAALTALSPAIRQQAQNNIKALLQERDRLREVLQQQAFVRQVFPSDANFLLVEMEKAGEFVQYCREHKMVLRDFSDKPRTEDCIRISVGTAEQNDRLFTLLENWS